MKKVNESRPFTQLALITGASSGIGAELAQQFAGKGFNLLLLGQDEDRLNTVSQLCQQLGAKVDTVTGDLTLDATMTSLLGTLEPLGPPTVLVNNAGIGLLGEFSTNQITRQQQLMQLNMQVPVSLTAHVLPSMIRNGTGLIINIGSLYDTVPVLNQSLYGASKAFIGSWTRALTLELTSTKLRVMLALPGSTSTQFRSRMGGKSGHSAPASEVAKKIVDDALAGKRLSIPGWYNKVYYSIVSMLPLSMAARLTEAINRHRLK